MKCGTHSLFAAAVAMAIIACSLGAAAAVAGDDEDAAAASAVREVVETGIADALAVLRDETLTDAERRRKFGDVLAERVDFEVVSRLALGAAWRDLDPAQRSEFVREFRTHLLAVGAHATERYNGEDVTIAGDRKEARRDWTVHTHITRTTPDGSVRLLANVDFRLRERDERWRIIDVRIAGVSMAMGFRTQFESIVNREGVERVLAILRERNRARKGDVDG